MPNPEPAPENPYDDLDKLFDFIQSVVRPVIKTMLRPGELDELRIIQPDEELPYLSVHLTVVGEEFTFYVWQPQVEPPWTDEEMRERFASNLQDSISESRFAWGELREY